MLPPIVGIDRPDTTSCGRPSNKLYTKGVHYQSMTVAVTTVGTRTGRAVMSPLPSAESDLILGVKTAIERSQGYLLGVQKPEGFWVGELMVDSTLVSDTIAYHHWNGKVDREWQRKAVN